MPRKTLLRTFAALAAVGTLLVAGQAAFQTSTPTSVTVSWGDTLWSLSQRYGVSMQALAAANHMRVTDVLYAGRTIDLPSSTAPPSSFTSWPYAKAVIPTTTPQVVNPPGSFCATYQPPTTPQGQLPAALAGDHGKLALRSTFAHWAAVYNVPLSLMEGEAWEESGWQNNVVSPAGAVGIGQLLPATAAFVNQSLGTRLQLTVASDNIRMMAVFLGYLLRATGGQICDAVASYYQGLTATVNLGVLPVSQIYVRDVLSLRPRFLGA
ncbi:MAG: LysM peptidoglycan-binding domain-containing protein [Acidimicrobiales bacterium]